jgi:hypothetical protein
MSPQKASLEAVLSYAHGQGLICPAFVGRSGARSSKNSKANRIETGEKSGGIQRNLFGGSKKNSEENS